VDAIVLLPGEGETVAVGPSTATLKALGDTTAGTFFLAETTIAPGFLGPPPHYHRTLHDAFYVIDGTLTLRVGDDIVDAPAGTFALIPPETVHTFSNRSGAPVTFLNLNTPSGWENYLRDLGAAAAEGPLDHARMAAVMRNYDFVLA
jgi:mannose-6-phosphate isomerase-like protein (cupin superfamily)